MKPQQQYTDVQGHSNVYVQKPDGEQINIEAENPLQENLKKDDADQTARNTPTKSSGEVTDGEDA